jgi:uncharacterized protein (DUF2267 family)
MTSLTHIWDKALFKSNLWISKLSDELGWANAPLTLLGLRAVLHALRDRLPPDEAVELSAQMPLIIKGVYFDGWDPSATPVKARTKEEFLGLVRIRLQRAARDVDAERLTRAVFRLIADRVSEGEIRDVRGMLPSEVAELWPAAVPPAAEVEKNDITFLDSSAASVSDTMQAGVR